MSSEAEIWKIVYDEISSILGVSEISMKLWFGNMELVKMSEDGIAYLSIDNDYKKGIIESKYTGTLKTAFKTAVGFDVNPIIISTERKSFEEQLADILCADDKAENTDEQFHTVDTSTLSNIKLREISDYKKKQGGEKNSISPDGFPKRYNPESDKMEPIPLNQYCEELERRDGMLLISKSSPNFSPEYTFENFVVGSSNELAHAACVSVSHYPAGQYNPLYIYGAPGLGKTHLLYAITKELSVTRPSFTIIYVKSEDFTNELISSISHNRASQFREKYRNADVLLIDDIQFIAGKQAVQEEFFHTFNALYESNKQIILASDRPPKDINPLEVRIRSRFESGYLVDIQSPDLELRMAILKQKIKKFNIDVSNDVLMFIAENVKDNIRQIEGIVKKLNAYAYMRGEKITLELVEKLSSDVVSVPVVINEDKIMKKVSEKLSVPVEDIMSKKRTKEIMNARHIIAYLLRTLTDMSFISIGKFLNRDHSTIMSSVEKVEEDMKNDSSVEAEIKDIINHIRTEQ